MRNKLLVLVMLLGVVGCHKADNRVDSTFFEDSDFAVSCLHGFNYLVRVSASKSYMAPKFDRGTGMPERCGQ